MDVYLNGNQLDLAPATNANVEVLLALLRRELPDQLVVSVVLDGTRVEDDRLEEVRAMSLARPGRLELEAVAVRTLVSEALGQAADMLEQTRDAHDTIAELLAQGRNGPAMEQLNQLFAAWNAAETALLQAAQLAGVDLETPAAEGDPTPAEHVETLRQMLGRLRGLLEKQDLVAVADLVEYELPDNTDHWQVMLVRLQDALLAERA